MIKVLDIKKYPRIKNHFKIYFSNNTNFIIDPDTIVKYKLCKDFELDENKLKEVIKSINSNSIIGYSFYLISNKSYSTKSLKEKLEQKGYFKEDIDKVILRFKELGYINDIKFAQNLVEYLKSKGKGPLYIKNELKQHDIEPEIITELLNNEEETEPYLQIIDIIKKKFSSFNNKDDKSVRKMAGFFLRRGFSSEDICKAFRNYCKDSL